MHDNHCIRNITPLAGLLHLHTLILRGNSLSDITTLGGLANLQSLRLENNSITDIAPLGTLTDLTYLDLRNNPLNDDAYEIYVPQIFVNCTITDNFSDEPGAGLRTVGSHVTVTNSILWGNAPCRILTDDPNSLSIAYTDIEGGWPGEGNVDSDPQFAQVGSWMDEDSNLPTEPNDRHVLFVPGDYHLKSEAGRWALEIGQWVLDVVTSPCIDMGDPLCPIGKEPPPNG